MATVPNPIFPSDDDVRRAVQAIHDRPEKLVLVATGGGAGVQRMLWDVPGASRTLLDAQFPYDMHAFDRYVGRPPPGNRYCTAEAALLLARKAYERARELDPSGNVIGAGATMTLVTDREKKGPCRIFVAVVGYGGGVRKAVEMTLTPDQAASWSRPVQGELADHLILNCLLEALELRPLRISFAKSGTSVISYLEPWVVIMPDGRELPESAISPETHVLYPGSFNPRHFGHDQMIATVQTLLGKEVVCLIERDHPTKGPLSDAEIARRVGQFAWKSPVMVTDQVGLYVDKARRFPGYGFIVGADTMRRICRSDDYGSIQELDAALEQFIRLGTHFYVFDRAADPCSEAYTLHQIGMPDRFRALCTRCEGRWDVSSTQIRAGLKPA